MVSISATYIETNRLLHLPLFEQSYHLMANAASKRFLSPSSRFSEALGKSETFLFFQQQLARVAGVSRPVVLIGERGTGKELAAARIHYLSPRWSGPFVKLNCAALAPSVLESELFGHEAGAFTGANRLREGRFESAHGGTLFLDELGLMPLAVQEKLLRVVEYGTFELLGSSEEIAVDVRLVAATSVDLRSLVAEGRFKADLLDRLAFQILYLPPLRLREGDIPVLANHFAQRFAVELGLKSTPSLSPSALAELQRYDWPGNVRELKNVIERAVYLSETPEISLVTLNPFNPPFALSGAGQTAHSMAAEGNRSEPASPGAQFPVDFDSVIRLQEVRLVRSALAAAHYQQHQAARLLGLTYDRFRGLYRKYKESLERKARDLDV
jgi:psp operon transcriptional activator